MLPKNRDFRDIFTLVFSILLLLIFWLFYSLCVTRDLTASDALAFKMAKNQTVTNFFITTIASILGTVTAFLFSQAVASALRTHLTHKWMELGHFQSAIHLTGGRPARHGGLVWLVLTTLIAVCFTTLTSGFNTLITPTRETVTSSLENINGVDLVDIDYQSPLFPAFDNSIGDSKSVMDPILEVCIWVQYYNIRVPSCLDLNPQGMWLAGLSSIKQNLSISAIGEIDTFSFQGSSLGIYPRGPNGLRETNDTLYLPYSLSGYNYTVQQPGYTANISCDYVNDGSLVPSQNSLQDIQNHPLLTNTSISVGYPIMGYTERPSGGWNLVVIGRGVYEGLANITCAINPYALTAEVSYFSMNNSFSAKEAENSTPYSRLKREEEFVIQGLIAGINWSQSAGLSSSSSNKLMDGIFKYASIYSTADHQGFLPLWEAALKGMLEYTATYSHLLRVSNAARQNYSTEGLTEKPLMELHGEFSREVFTWSKDRHTVPWTLFPLTIFILIIIGIAARNVILGWGRDHSNAIREADPTAVIDMMLLTASGDLKVDRSQGVSGGGRVRLQTDEEKATNRSEGSKLGEMNTLLD